MKYLNLHEGMNSNEKKQMIRHVEGKCDGMLDCGVNKMPKARRNNRMPWTHMNVHGGIEGSTQFMTCHCTSLMHKPQKLIYCHEAYLRL